MGVGEERRNQLVGQVAERLVVISGHQQRVAGEEGTVVEEGERTLVLEDHMTRLIAGDDLAPRNPGTVDH